MSNLERREPSGYPTRARMTQTASVPWPELNDETLRDGVQSPSVRHPSLEDKRAALHLMARLGVRAVSLGLPGASARERADVACLLKEVAGARLGLHAHAAARTVVADLEPIARIVQAVGAPLAAYAFIGSSPIRRFAEGWEVDDLLRTTEIALEFARQEGIEVAFVTEDTTRSRPDDLERLLGHALRLGVRRLVLCDTVGHATPSGAARLVRFARDVARSHGIEVALDWHGHDDRGLAVANALAAAEAGVDRIHGTLLGVGERCGNAALDQLILARARAGAGAVDVEALEAYRELVCAGYDWEIPPSYPWLTTQPP